VSVSFFIGSPSGFQTGSVPRLVLVDFGRVVGRVFVGERRGIGRRAASSVGSANVGRTNITNVGRTHNR
jgi:hypothetical protein